MLEVGDPGQRRQDAEQLRRQLGRRCSSSTRPPTSFYVGGAVKYESKRYGGQPDTAAAFDATTGAYTQPVPVLHGARPVREPTASTRTSKCA